MSIYWRRLMCVCVCVCASDKAGPFPVVPAGHDRTSPRLPPDTSLAHISFLSSHFLNASPLLLPLFPFTSLSPPFPPLQSTHPSSLPWRWEEDPHPGRKLPGSLTAARLSSLHQVVQVSLNYGREFSPFWRDSFKYAVCDIGVSSARQEAPLGPPCFRLRPNVKVQHSFAVRRKLPMSCQHRAKDAVFRRWTEFWGD